MPVPSTPVLDDFNTGANQNLVAGTRAGYGATKMFGADTGFMRTDAVPTYATGPTSGAFYSAQWATAWTDQEIVLTMGSLISDVYLYTRTTDPALGSINAYELEILGGVTWTVRPITAGSYGLTITSASQLVSTGDIVALSSVGSTHEMWYQPSGGSWSMLGTGTNSAHTSGMIGMDVRNSRIDTLAGGDLTPVVGQAGINFLRKGDRRA